MDAFFKKGQNHLILPLTATTRCRTFASLCLISGELLKAERMKKQPLANAELAVMDLLWREERLTARQIRERIYIDSAKAQHGTVQKLLQRLEDKGFVERDLDLPVHFFSAKISRETYAQSQMELLAAKLTGGSLAPLITYLVEGKKLSHAELNRLRAFLDAHKMKEDQHDQPSF
jgi:BlaI family penicillinase repressor